MYKLLIFGLFIMEQLGSKSVGCDTDLAEVAYTKAHTYKAI